MAKEGRNLDVSIWCLWYTVTLPEFCTSWLKMESFVSFFMYCIHLINPARWTLGQVHLLKDVSFNLPQWQPDMEDVCKHELAHTPFSDVKHCSPNQFKSSSSSWPCAHPTPSFHFAPLPRGSAGNTGRAEIGLINIWHWWGGRWWGARSSPVRTNCFTEKQNKKKTPLLLEKSW